MARFFLLECFSGPLIQPNPEIRYMTLLGIMNGLEQFMHCFWKFGNEIVV